MTKKRLWLTVAISALIAPAVVHAQGEPEPGIKFGGFVKFDAFNDTRAVTAARDDMFLLYPAPRSQITSAPASLTAANADAGKYYPFLDSTDTNAHGQTGMTAIQSRISGKITGPDAFGAKVTGLLELDFFGTADAYVQLGRLRHAWVNLDWGKTSFRAGQDWHPLFLQGGIFPGTLQFNPLAPIHPFGRAPQMAFTMKPAEGLRLSVYALSQGYHSDYDGNLAPAAPGNKPARNARIPELAAQADYTVGGFTIGGTYSHKELEPRSTTPTLDGTSTVAQVGQNTSHVNFNIYQAYLQLKQGDMKIKASTTWGDNWSQLLGTGGYGFKQSIIDANLSAIMQSQGISATEANGAAALYNAFTKREYVPTRARGYWAEFAYGKEVEFGIVGGMMENLGAASEINIASVVGRTPTTLKKVVTIAPRVKFTQGKTMIGLEYIYSAASYMEDDKSLQAIYSDLKDDGGNLNGSSLTATGGTQTTIPVAGLNIANSDIRDSNGRIGKTYTVTNHRIQFSVQQNF